MTRPMRGRYALNSLNFFTAAIQTGFGPFIAVWLTQNGWSLGAIGVALSIGTLAQLVAQLPAGFLVDHIHHKRNLTAAALIGLAASALMLAPAPTRILIWGGEVGHALASAVMVPAIAALTLSMCGHGSYSERLGVNARYASLGAAIAAALLGTAASVLSEHIVFIATAALAVPALASLALIHREDRVDPDGDHPALRHPREREHWPWHVFRTPALHVFAVAVVLFQLANAAILPMALNTLAERQDAPGWVISATVIVPQAITALISPRVGRLAQSRGRRPVLLAGFAAVPLRVVLIALFPGAIPLVLFQALDGVSAAVLGLMLPLIAADLTKTSGYLNMAIGALGLAAGLGATFSTTLAGIAADRLGQDAALLGLAAAGAAAFGLLWLAMPETRPAEATDGKMRPAPVAAGQAASRRRMMRPR